MAPTLGPTIGGWITDNFSWRWIFFINIPIVIISLYLTHRLVEDPHHIQKEVKEARSGKFRLDYIGFSLLALTFGSLEFVLDKGQQDDWFGFGFITTFSIIFAVCFVSVIFTSCGWRGTSKDPFSIWASFPTRLSRSSWS